MPYLNERATMQPLHALLNMPQIHQSLHAFQSLRPDVPVPANRVARANLGEPQWLPATTLSFDGSIVEAALDLTHPHSKVVYLTVAATCLDSSEIRRLDLHRPIDPIAYRATMRTQRLYGVLPFANVVTPHTVTTVDAFRQSVYELFCTSRVAPESESLLETLAALVAHRRNLPVSALHYLTDALGIHGRMAPWGGQWRVMTEALRAIEFVWLIHYLRWLSTRPNGLSASLAVVVDGPLAVFGNASWLSRAVRRELARLFKPLLRTKNVPMIIGIEKTGGLTAYAELLDACGALDSQTAFLLTHGDIRRAMQAGDEDTQAYGQQHYIGRKLIYKTISQQVVVVNVPSLTSGQHCATRADPIQFSRLAAIMDYLDSATQTPYQNGVSALTTAHAATSLSAVGLYHLTPLHSSKPGS